MKTIVILYPQQFNCYSKFSRKTSKILSKIENYEIVYPTDPNTLIHRYFQENDIKCELIQNHKWQNINVRPVERKQVICLILYVYPVNQRDISIVGEQL